jgi:glycosyltransferase involved in cell wall biosynthesis
MKLSVIIPCYNEADTIATQLEALAKQSWPEPWEVIVSDNGSTDASLTIVEKYRSKLPHLRIVDASARQGAPHAINVGAQAAAGDAIAVCDADDEIAPGWVAAIGEALSRYDFVASRFEFTKLNEPWALEARSCGYGTCGQENGLPKIGYPPYLPFSGGCGLGVKKSIHDAVGGHDESLPYLHDPDYCFKIQLLGIELHFVPEAVVHVRCHHTFKGIFHQARRWAKYSITVYKKYRDTSPMKVSQPWRRYISSWRYFLLLFGKWIVVLSLTPLYLTNQTRMLKHLPQFRSKGDIGVMVWRLGWLIGQLQGSIKNRVHPV